VFAEKENVAACTYATMMSVKLRIKSLQRDYLYRLQNWDGRKLGARPPSFLPPSVLPHPRTAPEWTKDFNFLTVKE